MAESSVVKRAVSCDQRRLAADAIEQFALSSQFDAQQTREIAREIPRARLNRQRQPIPHQTIVHAAAFDPRREQRIATLRLRRADQPQRCDGRHRRVVLAVAVERAQIGTLPVRAGAGGFVVGDEDVPRAAAREVVHPFVVQTIGDRRIAPTFAKCRDFGRGQVIQPQQVILIVEIGIQRIVGELRFRGLECFDLTVVEAAQRAEILLALVAEVVGRRVRTSNRR